MPCVSPNKLVYDIPELPNALTIASGDKFIIETLNGPYQLNYDNFIIDTNQITFAAALQKHETDIALLSSKMDPDYVKLYEALYVEQINPVVTQIQNNLDDLQGYVYRLKASYEQLIDDYDV